MTLEQRFITGFREVESDEPGLVQEDDGSVWLIAPDGSRAPIGGGASAATDYTVTFANSNPVEPTFPIVAVSLPDNTITVEGNLVEVCEFLKVAPTNGGGLNVVGSTGNDQTYFPSDAVYDHAANRTLITLVADLSDPTADGVVQPCSIFTASLPVPPNGSVEWVLVETTEVWETFSWYGQIGDDDDPTAFGAGTGDDLSGITAYDVGKWQWPALTVEPDGILLAGSSPGIKRYPDGGTVRVIFTLNQTEPGGGVTKVTIHRHFGDTLPDVLIHGTP